MIAIGYKKLPLMLASVMVLALSCSLLAQDDHSNHGDGEARAELEMESSIPLNPATGSEIGFVYEAFLSPQQEGGEEEDTPVIIPPQFRSTTPSVPRNERLSQGHAAIEFTNDLSKAYVFLAVENVNIADLNMLHLHCGRPGQLGPIIVDFSLMGDLKTYLEDGILKLEVHNEDIEAVLNGSHGPVDAFTMGCPIVPGIPDKVKTVGGLKIIADQGELYFNLHTTGQTYFGDMRGQFSAVAMP